jgi:hypothetical protein
MSDSETIKLLCKIVSEIFFELANNINLDLNQLDSTSIADNILSFRLDAAIKLQKMNPLYLVLEEICRNLDIGCEYGGTPSIISDIATGNGSLGKFDVYKLSKNNKVLLTNAIAVSGHNGDHKSKEWGARRRVSLYRVVNEVVIPSEYQDGLFVLDGEWKQKDINRLYLSGWNHIIRLDEIESFLTQYFS